MDQATPRSGFSQRVTCTGFGSPVNAAGGKAKTVIIQARQATPGTTGAATTANADNVFVYIQANTPGAAGGAGTTHSGICLAPGDVLTVAIEDTGLIWVSGTSGDSVNIVAIA